MTPLRQRMIEDMRIRNFAATTQRSYIHYVAQFAHYFHRNPAELDLGPSLSAPSDQALDTNLNPNPKSTPSESVG